MSKQAGNLVLIAVGIVVVVTAGVAYEILRGGCYIADLVTGRRPQ